MADNTLVFEDSAMSAGFAIVPNVVLRDPRLEPGPKVLYALLLGYGWRGTAFPGQRRLASDAGTTDRSIRRWLSELVSHELIRIERSGQGRTNRYVIRRLPDRTQTSGQDHDRTQTSGQDRTQVSGLERTQTSDKDQLSNSKRVRVLDTPSPNPVHKTSKHQDTDQDVDQDGNPSECGAPAGDGLLTFWRNIYSHHTATEYIPDVRDRRRLEELANHHGAKKLERLLVFFLVGYRDEWLTTKGLYTISEFQRNINAVAVQFAKANREKEAQQKTSISRVAEDATSDDQAMEHIRELRRKLRPHADVQ